MKVKVCSTKHNNDANRYCRRMVFVRQKHKSWRVESFIGWVMNMITSYANTWWNRNFVKLLIGFIHLFCSWTLRICNGLLSFDILNLISFCVYFLMVNAFSLVYFDKELVLIQVHWERFLGVTEHMSLNHIWISHDLYYLINFGKSGL